jgi:hypothetical protein
MKLERKESEKIWRKHLDCEQHNHSALQKQYFFFNFLELFSTHIPKKDIDPNLH